MDEEEVKLDLETSLTMLRAEDSATAQALYLVYFGILRLAKALSIDNSDRVK